MPQCLRPAFSVWVLGVSAVGAAGPCCGPPPPCPRLCNRIAHAPPGSEALAHFCASRFCHRVRVPCRAQLCTSACKCARGTRRAHPSRPCAVTDVAVRQHAEARPSSRFLRSPSPSLRLRSSRATSRSDVAVAVERSARCAADWAPLLGHPER